MNKIVMRNHEVIEALKLNPSDHHKYNLLGLMISDWIELLFNKPELISMVGRLHSYGVTKNDESRILSRVMVLSPSTHIHCDMSLISRRDVVYILVATRELDDVLDLTSLCENSWTDILVKRPELASKCNWNKFWSGDFINLIKASSALSDVIASAYNCGYIGRSIHVCIYDPTIITIGCFKGTKEHAITEVTQKYSGTKYLNDYIAKIESCFKKAEELANVKNI